MVKKVELDEVIDALQDCRCPNCGSRAFMVMGEVVDEFSVLVVEGEEKDFERVSDTYGAEQERYLVDRIYCHDCDEDFEPEEIIRWGGERCVAQSAVRS